MNTTLLISGIILLVLGYLVGVMKNTWLLSGFNERRVSNKEKLAKIVGGYEVIMGVVFIVSGFLFAQFEEILFGILVIGFLGLIIYSNVRLVDR